MFVRDIDDQSTFPAHCWTSIWNDSRLLESREHLSDDLSREKLELVHPEEWCHSDANWKFLHRPVA